MMSTAHDDQWIDFRRGMSKANAMDLVNNWRVGMCLPEPFCELAAAALAAEIKLLDDDAKIGVITELLAMVVAHVELCPPLPEADN